jgi:transposase
LQVSTRAIVEAHLDRWQVEERFRQSKDETLVSMRPVRHWTDGKIRCHLFSCVVALTYLRRLELKLAAGGVNRTADAVMGEMRRRHSVLSFRPGGGAPARRVETPTKTQSEVLSALGWRVDDRGVLQARVD